MAVWMDPADNSRHMYAFDSWPAGQRVRLLSLATCLRIQALMLAILGGWSIVAIFTAKLSQPVDADGWFHVFGFAAGRPALRASRVLTASVHAGLVAIPSKDKQRMSQNALPAHDPETGTKLKQAGRCCGCRHGPWRSWCSPCRAARRHCAASLLGSVRVPEASNVKSLSYSRQC